MPVARTQDSKYENCKVRVKFANCERFKNAVFVAHLHALGKLYIKFGSNRTIGYACSADRRF